MFVDSLRLPPNDAEQFADSTMGIPARRDVSRLACLHKSHKPATIVACVGGWSAAEHWDLTEQIFRDICVFTARAVPKRHQVIHNIQFEVTHVPPEQQFGTKTVWKKEKKLSVSDPTRTIAG